MKRLFMPKVFTRAIILTFVLMGLLVSTAYAATSEVGAFTDEMLKNFKQRFESYSQKIWNAALALFAILFLCQFAWAILQLFLQENLTFAAVVITVIRQGLTGSFFYWLLFDRTILNAIVESFEQLGSAGLNVAELLLIMEVAIGNIMRAVGKSSGVISGIALFFTGLFASIIMAFSLTTAITYMALVQVENYIVCSLGLILLGFGGSDHTRSYAVSYIRTLVHVGFKLFLATVIVRIGITAFHAATLGIGTDNESISRACMLLIAQSFFFLGIVKVIPEISNTLITGGSASSGKLFSEVGGSAAAVTGATAKGAGAAVAGAGAAMSGLYNLPRNLAHGAPSAIEGAKNVTQAAAAAFSSNMSKYQESGLGAGRAALSALGSTLWQGYMGQISSGGNTMNAVDLSKGGDDQTNKKAAGVAGASNGSNSNTGAASRASSTGSDNSKDAAADQYSTSGGDFASRSGHGAVGDPEGSKSSMDSNPASQSALDTGSSPKGSGASADRSGNTGVESRVGSTGSDNSKDASAGQYGTSGGNFASRAGHGAIGDPEGSQSLMDSNPASQSALDTGSSPKGSGASADRSGNTGVGSRVSSTGSDNSKDAAAGQYGTSGGSFASRSGHGAIGDPEGSKSSMNKNPASQSTLDTGSTPAGSGKINPPSNTELSDKYKIR